MKHLLRPLLPALAAFVLVAPSATAQQAQCADRARVLEMLENRYGETRRSLGVASGNGVMELHASAATGTWTLTMTLPNGMTCLISSGHGYQEADSFAPAKGHSA